VQDVFDFSEQLTPTVAAAVPTAIQVIIDLLGCGFNSQVQQTDQRIPQKVT